MKIELLWQRERFADIFADAAKRLLEASSGKRFDIQWRKRSPIVSGDRDWVCSDRLNAIYWSRCGPLARSAVRKHYGNHERPTWAAVQRTYIALATSAAGERVLARWLTIDPQPALAADLVFRGGGQRIRMMDYAQKQVWAVAKAGRDARGVTSELAFRRQLPGSFPAPRFIGSIDEGRGFCELLAPGVPLDQLGGDRAIEVRTAAETALGRLAQSKRRPVDASSYLTGLQARVEFDLASDLASETIRAVIGERFSAIARALEERQAEGIDLAPSHGDLSGDNVVADRDGFAITDWEMAGERHIGFTWIESATPGVRRPGFGRRLARTARNEPTAAALAAARRLIGDASVVGDRRWREIAVLFYLAERLVIDAGTGLSAHLHRAGPELAACALEIEHALAAIGVEV